MALSGLRVGDLEWDVCHLPPSVTVDLRKTEISPDYRVFRDERVPSGQGRHVPFLLDLYQVHAVFLIPVRVRHYQVVVVAVRRFRLLDRDGA